MKRTTFLMLLFFLAALTGCRKTNPTSFPDSYKNVLVIYSSGYNNLSGPLATDIEFELAKGEVPDKSSRNAIVIFSHSAPYGGPYSSGDSQYYTSRGDYETNTDPVLIRLYKDNGTARLDTVKRYGNTFNEVLPENMSQVLSDIKMLCPSEHYGLLYTSHGSAWMPPQKKAKLKSVGAHYNGSPTDRDETDIIDFAKAIPMRLDYIIFDACYMGAVEVAYQLRSCCSYFVGSATEIPNSGFDYVNLAQRVFSSGGAQLKDVCDDYLRVSSMGGIIALVECAKLDALAAEVAALVDKYRDNLYKISEDGNRATVQKYWCSSEYKYFYDLEDIFHHVGASDQELANLTKSIESAVIYENHTDIFSQGPVYLENCCGLSMYLPSNDPSFSSANNYYKTLDFNAATKLVK